MSAAKAWRDGWVASLTAVQRPAKCARKATQSRNAAPAEPETALEREFGGGLPRNSVTPHPSPERAETHFERVSDWRWFVQRIPGVSTAVDRAVMSTPVIARRGD